MADSNDFPSDFLGDSSSSEFDLEQTFDWEGKDTDPPTEVVRRQPTVDPIRIAMAEGWVGETSATELLTSTNGDSVAALRSALEQGKITAREYDIVAALSGLREVAPGYEVTGLLGRGGMGAVFRAEQQNLNREVALKTILVDAESSNEAMTRFEREARTIAKLRHPNIITAYDFGRHAGRLYLAMELVEGEDLDTRLRVGLVGEAFAWHIARQIAAALSAATKLGIVHRDIKPSNVLLVPAPDGSPLPDGIPLVKVADFGLAFLEETAASDRVTSANVAVGSPHYMAPELLAGADATPASDMYSLGATVFRMLAGRPPFSGKPLSGVIGEKLKGDIPRLHGVSKPTEQFVAQMMASDPEERPQSFSDVIRAIDQMLGRSADDLASPFGSSDDERTISLPRPSEWPGLSGSQPVSNHSLWKQLALMALAVVVTAGVVTMRAPSPPEVSDERSTAKPLAATSAMTKREISQPFNLLDNETLDIRKWVIENGEWQAVTSEETAQLVLQGRGGAVFRELPPFAARNISHENDAAPVFRLQCVVQRQVGTTAGLRFNLVGKRSAPQQFYDLRLSDDRVMIVPSGLTVEDDQELSQTVATSDTVSEVTSQVTLELCPQGWKCSVKVPGADGLQHIELPTVPYTNLSRHTVGFVGPTSLSDPVAEFYDMTIVELEVDNSTTVKDKST